MAQATTPQTPRNVLPGQRVFTAVVAVFSVAAVAVQLYETLQSTSVLNIITLGVLIALFALIHLQIVLLRWAGGRTVRRMLARLQGSAYISELEHLPNRNFLLAELRREMPRARKISQPFTVVLFSPHDLLGIRRRRGDDFTERTLHTLAGEIRRRVRGSDFAAYLGEGMIAVLLFECDGEGAESFLERVPHHVMVSDGHEMLDVPLEIRSVQYDMESIYATDVLRTVEDAEPEVLLDPEIHWSTLA